MINDLAFLYLDLPKFNTTPDLIERLEKIVDQNSFDDKFANYHINYWNFEKLKKMCIEAGFSNIYHSGFGQSLSPPLTNTKLFDNTHPKMSLYFEARK